LQKIERWNAESKKVHLMPKKVNPDIPVLMENAYEMARKEIASSESYIMRPLVEVIKEMGLMAIDQGNRIKSDTNLGQQKKEVPLTGSDSICTAHPSSSQR
jgi:hypothetical protein